MSSNERISERVSKLIDRGVIRPKSKGELERLRETLLKFKLSSTSELFPKANGIACFDYNLFVGNIVRAYQIEGIAGVFFKSDAHGWFLSSNSPPEMFDITFIQQLGIVLSGTYIKMQITVQERNSDIYLLGIRLRGKSNGNHAPAERPSLERISLLEVFEPEELKDEAGNEPAATIGDSGKLIFVDDPSEELLANLVNKHRAMHIARICAKAEDIPIPADRNEVSAAVMALAENRTDISRGTFPPEIQSKDIPNLRRIECFAVEDLLSNLMEFKGMWKELNYDPIKGGQREIRISDATDEFRAVFAETNSRKYAIYLKRIAGKIEYPVPSGFGIPVLYQGNEFAVFITEKRIVDKKE